MVDLDRLEDRSRGGRQRGGRGERDRGRGGGGGRVRRGHGRRDGDDADDGRGHDGGAAARGSGLLRHDGQGDRRWVPVAAVGAGRGALRVRPVLLAIDVAPAATVWPSWSRCARVVQISCTTRPSIGRHMWPHAAHEDVARRQVGVHDRRRPLRHDHLVEVAPHRDEAGAAAGRRLGELADHVAAGAQLAHERVGEDVRRHACPRAGCRGSRACGRARRRRGAARSSARRGRPCEWPTTCTRS